MSGSIDLCTWCKENGKVYLLSEWDYERNGDLKPEDISRGSDKKVFWKCDNGHKWQAIVGNRTRGANCPYCTNRTQFLRGNHRLLIPGKNDLEAWCRKNNREDILSEFDVRKNDGLLPNAIKYGSGQKIWWTCLDCGFSWRAPVNNRTLHNSGCPDCKKVYGTSFGEQAVYYYVKQVFPDSINGDNHLGVELDIYIPSHKIAIEYDGDIWHGTDDKTSFDNKKSRLCIDNGILLIRIREPGLPPAENCVCFVRRDSVSDKSLTSVIVELLNYLDPSNTINVNVSFDTSAILSQYTTRRYSNSLANCYPDIAKKWHPTKNGILTPDKVSKMSAHKVWWLDDCGHEYIMSINLKTRQDKPCGCPICGQNNRKSSITRIRGKKVCCIETEIVFDSVSAAADSVKVDRNAVSMACKNKQRTAGGFHWSFVDDNGNYDATIIEREKSNIAYINERLGECRMMNCGMKCTIINYDTSSCIDVRFEDGFVVYKKSYANFLKGEIANPNIKLHIGESVIANNGLMCTIIEYRNYNDIDVEFEDGTCVEHRNYGSFAKGEIKHPDYNSSVEKSRGKHIGERRIMNCGMEATIIEWIGVNDIDVRFEDGTVVCHKSYSNYKKGGITNPQISRKCDKTRLSNSRAKHLGETRMMNCGMNATIIEWNAANDINIMFDDGTIVTKKSYSNYCKGGIRNPNFE